MQAEQFRDLVAGVSESYLCDFLQVSLKTLRRWKAGTAAVPHATVLLIQVKLDGDLSALGGSDWEGFFFSKDGLHLPGWKYGFNPHQIRGMFFKCQMVRDYESTIRAQQKRIEELEGDIAMETRTGRSATGAW